MQDKRLLDGFLIADAAGLAGLTRTMLDYLCREQILVPNAPGRRGRGKPRKYSFGDVVVLRILARLLRAGVSVRRLKVALRSVRHLHKEIRPNSLPARYLVTDGKRVFLRSKDRLLDLDGSGQMSFLFVLELGEVRREVLKAVGAKR